MDIFFPDLFVVCQKCKGEGEIVERTSASPGAIGIISTTTAGSCPSCNGNGGKLTSAGEALAKFIQQLKKMGRL